METILTITVDICNFISYVDNMSEIIKLSEKHHLRKRTEMYLGSRSPHTQTIINFNGTELVAQEMTWTPAIYTCLREIIDNSLDEIIGHGFGNQLTVTYDEQSLSFSVEDNGRGIPIDYDETERLHKATMALTQTRTGRNFGDRKEVRGTNGIGASAVVFCSDKVDVIIKRDNKKFVQSFDSSNELFEEVDITEPKITTYKTDQTGTYISFKLSKSVFPDAILPIEFVKARIYDIAVAHPKLKITFNGEKINTTNVEKLFFKNHEFIKLSVTDDKFNSNFYIIPNFAEEGEFIHSTVNDIPVFQGGQHIDAFKRFFFSSILKGLEKENKKRGLYPNRSDIQEGLLIYNITRMEAPNFDSQSKQRLGNESVVKPIKLFFDDEAVVKNIIKSNSKWIDQIYERCSERTNRKEKEEIDKKNKKNLRTKVPKLLDANGKNRMNATLLICEGDCLDENTEILIFENDKFISKKLKDVDIGDLVLTHNNNLKSIVNKQKSIKDAVEIKIANHTLNMSKTHKMIVYTKDVGYEIKEAQYITIEHKFVKSLLGPNSQILQFVDIQDSKSEKYNHLVTVADLNEPTDIQQFYISDEAKLAIYDKTTKSLIMKKISEIDVETNFLILQDDECQ